MLIAAPESRAAAAAWQARRRPPFTVVTGRQGTPHEAVGLTRKVFGALQQSGTLLIDRAGVIRHAHAATLPTHGYDQPGVLAAVAALPPVPSGRDR